MGMTKATTSVRSTHEHMQPGDSKNCLLSKQIGNGSRQVASDYIGEDGNGGQTLQARRPVYNRSRTVTCFYIAICH